MKKSNYNFLIPYKDNETIIFNPLYGTLGKLEDKIVEAYNNDSLTCEDKDILYKKHVFIDDNINEIEIIAKDRAKGIQDPTKKVYRIWTTSGCNAKCYYCFEQGVKVETMTRDTALKVADYISSRINKNDKIRLEWFGGEPLLNTEVIRIISDIVIKECKDKEAKYISSIITNGSLVNEDIVKLFKECNISRAQITFDGSKDVYNKAKNYYNSTAHNFDNVMNSVKLLSTNGIRVSLRLNYDNANYDSISELIDYIHDNFNSNKLVNPYIYPIWSSTKEDGYTSEAFADNNYLKLIDKLVSYNMMKPDAVIGIRRKVKQCAARNINSIAILPNGDISKCSETFTQIIGNIDNGILDEKKYNEWISTTTHPECVTCKYLPVCNDGCQSSRYTRMDSCFPTKNIFEDIIRWYVSTLDNQKS